MDEGDGRPDLLQSIAGNLPAHPKPMRQPGAMETTSTVFDVAVALHELQIDMSSTSINSLHEVATSLGTALSQFPRRLRIKGFNPGPNTPFRRRADHTIPGLMRIPEIQQLRHLLQHSFPGMTEFELALGPLGIPVNHLIHPGDIPKILFRILNGIGRPITALYLTMEARDWCWGDMPQGRIPQLTDRVLGQTETLRLDWGFFASTSTHPMVQFYRSIFRKPLRNLFLHGKGMNFLFPSVGPTLAAIPSRGCKLQQLTLTDTYLSDSDLFALIPRLPVLRSITLKRVQVHGHWPEALTMLSTMCTCLSAYTFRLVLWVDAFEREPIAQTDAYHCGLPVDTQASLSRLADSLEQQRVRKSDAARVSISFKLIYKPHIASEELATMLYNSAHPPHMANRSAPPTTQSN
ncbi:uncharacterized protein BP01DRAFT_425853 [Aspergillus saccharolyticus JOP 1030-1]|uniref:F-box domain protein n=1 Tax=Aspergillus saccharolyticus JOP 1030-1 TaxID=1450539 RepID=A0A318Z522_9EURO|nr:hypothetical protein BP01DRAFT_425853 [Aspergillus saccharolyticus JOP 1030-1]PYH42159.1 hypothetical protein BP01DRAFT_425853 [Aspergillus saccharolyticus JOP 1030-1]